MADGYGPKGFPKYTPESNAELWPKLEEVGAFAAKVGNYRADTSAVRLSLSGLSTEAEQASVGMIFRETDTGRVFRCTSVSPVTWVSATDWVHTVGGAGAGDYPAPPAGTQPIFRTGYAKLPLNGDWTSVTIVPAFPAECLHVSVTSIDDPKIAPVVPLRQMTPSAFQVLFPGVTANATVTFTYLAVGY